VQHECRNVTDGDDEDVVHPISLCKTIYKKYYSETFFAVARLPIISDENILLHTNRARSEKLDYEAINEPVTKRASSGCSSRLRKMTLRSNTPNSSPGGGDTKRRKGSGSSDRNYDADDDGSGESD
jgi:hypothetical protein